MQPLYNFRRRGLIDIQAAAGRHMGVRHAGQYRTHPRHFIAYAFDRVDDTAFLVDKDNVAVPSHNFDGQRQYDAVAKLVCRFKVEMQDAVKPRLCDIDELCACQMLAHQHTEHRRRLGVVF